MATFSEIVGKWGEDTLKATEGTWKLAAKKVTEDAQKPRHAGGRMRVDTGYLRASLMASTAKMPVVELNSTPSPGTSYNYSNGEVFSVIDGAKLGQTLYLGWTASYAAAREYGANSEPPDAFLRTAVQKWPLFVQEARNEMSRKYKVL